MKILFLFFVCTGIFVYTQQAFISIPVANAYTSPSYIKTNQPVHQCLFNEPILVIESDTQKALIELPSAFYITPTQKTPYKRFWVARDDITLHTDLDHHNVIALPKNKDKHSDDFIITTAPWVSEDGTVFSAGTIFVLDKTNTQKHKKIPFLYLDPITKTVCNGNIPQKSCLKGSFLKKQSINQKRELFIKILKEWAHQKEHYYIPYLFGGTSFVKTAKHPYSKESISCGIDCSGLVLRVAQMVGIEQYQYKNTTTIKEFCPQVSTFETLKNGDLILIKGHVMIISDIKKNRIIEARGYDHGFGRVQEICINHVFKNITSIRDLWNHAQQKNIVTRLDINQQERDSFSEVTFHTLC